MAQCQMINPENIHTSNIILTEQIMFRNMYASVHTYIHVVTTEKEAINLKESGEEGFGGRKRNRELL